MENIDKSAIKSASKPEGEDEDIVVAPEEIISEEDFRELEKRFIKPDKIEAVYMDGGGVQTKGFFKDEGYKQLNKGCYILLYLMSETIKEINEGEYSVNSEQFKPDNKQLKILGLIKDKMKQYIDNYKTHSPNDLKMKLNLLVIEFLKLVDDETKETIYKNLLKYIFEKRKKQLKKGIENYRKYYDEIFETIETEEVEGLLDKLCRPVKEIVKDFKIEDKPKKIDIEGTINKLNLKKGFKINRKDNEYQSVQLDKINKIKEELLSSQKLSELYIKYDNNENKERQKKDILELKQLIDKYRESVKNLQITQDKFDKIKYYNEMMDLKKKILELDYTIESKINKTDLEIFVNSFDVNKLKEYEKIYEEIQKYYYDNLNPYYELKELKQLHLKMQTLKENEELYKKAKLEMSKFKPEVQKDIIKTYDIFKSDVIMFKINDLVGPLNKLELKEYEIFMELAVFYLYNLQFNGVGDIFKLCSDLFDFDRFNISFNPLDIGTEFEYDVPEGQMFYEVRDNAVKNLSIILDPPNRYINNEDDVFKQNVYKYCSKKDETFVNSLKSYSNIIEIIKNAELKEEETEGVYGYDNEESDEEILQNDKPKDDKPKDAKGIKTFKGKKGGTISPNSKNKGGNIQEKLQKYNPSFNPPTRPKKDMINNVNNKRKIRDARITNYTRRKIENNINNLNNSTDLYNNINNINPDLLNVLSKPQGSGTFFTKKVNKIINSIKAEKI